MFWKGEQMGKGVLEIYFWGKQGFKDLEGMIVEEIILFVGVGGERMLLLEWKVLGKV